VKRPKRPKRPTDQPPGPLKPSVTWIVRGRKARPLTFIEMLSYSYWIEGRIRDSSPPFPVIEYEGRLYLDEGPAGFADGTSSRKGGG
jgi:hypothetical protein